MSFFNSSYFALLDIQIKHITTRIILDLKNSNIAFVLYTPSFNYYLVSKLNISNLFLFYSYIFNIYNTFKFILNSTLKEINEIQKNYSSVKDEEIKNNVIREEINRINFISRENILVIQLRLFRSSYFMHYLLYVILKMIIIIKYKLKLNFNYFLNKIKK